MRRTEDGFESLLRSAMLEYAVQGVPGPSEAARRKVLAGLAGARRRRRHGRRLVLALVAAAVVVAIATGAALATGVLNTRDIVQVPADVWQQHFQQQHHGDAAKGTAGPGQAGTLAEAQRRAGFHVHTLQGMAEAQLTGVTSSTVTFRDGSKEPEVVVDYRLGDAIISVIEVKDPNPTAPFEIPNAPPGAVRTIGGEQYLFGTDSAGEVRYVQFKTTDGIVFSVNFFGPPDASSSVGPGGVDPQVATDVVRHLG